MKQVYRWNGLILVVLVATTAVVARAQEATNPAAAVVKAHIMVTPQEVRWEDCPPVLPRGARCATIEGDRRLPNVLFTYRLKMPDDYRIAPHFHPADEHLTVISGTFNMGLGDRLDTNNTRAMIAGSFIVMPKGTHHFAWTKGETVIQVHAIGPWAVTYVNPADDPAEAVGECRITTSCSGRGMAVLPSAVEPRR